MIMNQELTYEHIITAGLPNATVRISNSGVCVWVDVIFNGRNFVMQITPKDGVGVSKQDLSGSSDLSGHDKTFDNLADAIDYIKTNVD